MKQGQEVFKTTGVHPVEPVMNEEAARLLIGSFGTEGEPTTAAGVIVLEDSRKARFLVSVNGVNKRTAKFNMFARIVPDDRLIERVIGNADSATAAAVPPSTKVEESANV
jgi:hypothetical protein